MPNFRPSIVLEGADLPLALEVDADLPRVHRGLGSRVVDAAREPSLVDPLLDPRGDVLEDPLVHGDRGAAVREERRRVLVLVVEGPEQAPGRRRLAHVRDGQGRPAGDAADLLEGRLERVDPGEIGDGAVLLERSAFCRTSWLKNMTKGWVSSGIAIVLAVGDLRASRPSR
jgi:hypothetical protein